MNRIAVIGGGAAGFFAALSAKEHHPNADVLLLEKTSTVLAKVKISGGGRCNVTHATKDIDALCSAYPRGGKQLRNNFYRFDPTDTRNWFESRGVALKIESDGRVFPVSNNSQTIIDCLVQEAKKRSVVIQYNTSISKLESTIESKWSLITKNQSFEGTFDAVIIATGGSPKKKGLDWLGDLGHEINSPVPSLFTFNMPEESITELMGVSVQDAQVKIKGTKFQSQGSLLITHWGMSGPAVLKVSSIGARSLNALDYQFDIQINWVQERNTETLFDQIQKWIKKYPQKTLTNQKAFSLPNRLWLFLLKKCNLSPDKKWSELGKKQVRKMVELLSRDTYKVSGKTTFKEEFVTCGGVKLNNIDLRTMESKKCSGLYFAGEVMDIDAITGGYNFQAAWTTGFIAGQLKK
ncbi:MAG: NAD(P)/FAD-dependent oxidoreductase [Flavobacteriaceae bacterium]